MQDGEEVRSCTCVFACREKGVIAAAAGERERERVDWSGRPLMPC